MAIVNPSHFRAEPLHTKDPEKQGTLEITTTEVFDVFDDTITSSHDIPQVSVATGFPLLDLPVELQRLVIYHYFEGPFDITLENERLSMFRSHFHVLGFPSTDILCISRHIHYHATSVFKRLFTGRLVLNSVFNLIPLQRQERFSWLRQKARILHFSDSSVHPERWSRYFTCVSSLRKLEIEMPWSVKIDGLESESEIEKVLQGHEDKKLLGGLDPYRMALIRQLREGKLEVELWQKYEVGGGIVVLGILLTDQGLKVVRRRWQPGSLDPINLLDQKPALDLPCPRLSLWEWHQAMTA